MPWWGWIAIGVAWVYLGFVAWRWDRYESSLLGTESVFMCCLLLWPLAFVGIAHRPRRPWLAREPRPSATERVVAAQARSLELEREAGLEFDGIFLLPDKAGRS